MGIRRPHRLSEYPNIWLYLLDETHITVTLATALVLVYTRDPHVAWFAIGAVGASQTAKGIKRIVRVPRPPAPPPTSTRPAPIRPKKTYGMPSTHSTALTFFMVYILPALATLLPSTAYPVLLPVAQVGLVGLWAAGLWSRRELGYHTASQIVVGALLGGIMALGWKGLWNAGKERGWGVEDALGGLMEAAWSRTAGRILG